MTPDEITNSLTSLFGKSVQVLASGSWQVEIEQFRLLVLLSDDHSWLRALVPLAPASEAQPFLEQLLEANFDATQETRYALHQGVLWAMFQHSRDSLTLDDWNAALQQLRSLHQQGLSDCFNQFLELRLTQIIQAAKSQGQSLQATLQTLQRFYDEGLLGEMGQSAESREQVLAAWQRQLERLWSEVDA